MPDRFTEVTRTGYGSRISRSFAGLIIGPVLFIASFVLLYWNEGRQDMSLIAKTATTISSEAASTDASLDGKLVDTTGIFVTDENIGDDYLKPGNYISLERKVEMYAWKEDKEEKSSTSVGGSETTETTYTYEEEWTNDPDDSDDFRYPADHENPAKKIEDKTVKANTAKVGIYEINLESVTLPDSSNLPLNADNTIINSANKEMLSGNYIFIGEGTLDDPHIGDLRISYDAVSSGTEVTLFGKLDGSKITTFADSQGNSLYRAFIGTRDEAVATMHTEFAALTWILRAAGFLLMWIGLSAFFGPLSTFLSFLPFLGNLSRSIIGLITFVVALVLSALTIFISILIH